VDAYVSAPSPGPLAEEAARLVAALSAWAAGGRSGDGSGDAGDTSGPRDAPAGGAWPHLQEGLSGFADGSAACRVCPLCQALALFRQAKPETFAHLLDASTAITAALRSVVDQHEAGRSRASGVERIDLDPPHGGGRAASA
jgi:hypothetical protein